MVKCGCFIRIFLRILPVTTSSYPHICILPRSNLFSARSNGVLQNTTSAAVKLYQPHRFRSGSPTAHWSYDPIVLTLTLQDYWAVGPMGRRTIEHPPPHRLSPPLCGRRQPCCYPSNSVKPQIPSPGMDSWICSRLFSVLGVWLWSGQLGSDVIKTFFKTKIKTLISRPRL